MNRVFLVIETCVGISYPNSYHVPTLVAVVRTYAHTRTMYLRSRANNYIHSRRDDINTKDATRNIE